ncbi:MAG: NifB/NifX family molybdenum-iron cluster-binding protein [Desulfuromonas sp.]|nr:NifB/NifX family molybdenum-iron cluster-binding protein [Desulfuromonas sp.]
MKIAIPTAQGKLATHFGHCEIFTMLTIDTDTNTVTGTETLQPPTHEPGVLPRWLGEQKVDVIIAGGMGQRAQQLFSDQGIKVIVGACAEEPTSLIKQYLAGTLTTGINLCDH